MQTKERTTPAENFLMSIDTSIPKIDHMRNCFRDAHMYKWSAAVIIQIMSGIEKVYADL
jgi:hypothetical protein